MRYFAAAAFAIACAVFPFVSIAGSTFYFKTNGAVSSLSTPWGDYVAVDEGGGEYWVGTKAEYEHGVRVGIIQGLGYRHSRVESEGSNNTFVPTSSLRTQVGDTPIDAVSVTVLPEGPVNIPGWRTVTVDWIAPVSSPRQAIKCLFFSSKGPVRSDDAVDGAEEFRELSLALPNRDLLGPVVLMFYRRGAKPGILKIASVAALDYEYTTKKLAGLPLSGEDRRHLAMLRKMLFIPEHHVTPKSLPHLPDVETARSSEYTIGIQSLSPDGAFDLFLPLSPRQNITTSGSDFSIGLQSIDGKRIIVRGGEGYKMEIDAGQTMGIDAVFRVPNGTKAADWTVVPGSLTWDYHPRR